MRVKSRLKSGRISIWYNNTYSGLEEFLDVLKNVLKVIGGSGAVLLEFVEQIGMPIKSSHQALIDRLGDFPAMIFVCKDGIPDKTFASQTAYFGSILPAAWSLMIALRARGIGCTWTTLLSARQDEVAGVLRIPDSVRQVIMLPVGYSKGAVLRVAQRKKAAEEEKEPNRTEAHLWPTTFAPAPPSQLLQP